MTGFPRACSSCGGILLGRRTRFCASCAPPRRSFSDPRYGSPQSNLWTLCMADNNSKRDLTVEEWKAALVRRAPPKPMTNRPPIRGIYIVGGRQR